LTQSSSFDEKIETSLVFCLKSSAHLAFENLREHNGDYFLSEKKSPKSHIFYIFAEVK